MKKRLQVAQFGKIYLRIRYIIFAREDTKLSTLRNGRVESIEKYLVSAVSGAKFATDDVEIHCNHLRAVTSITVVGIVSLPSEPNFYIFPQLFI